MQHEYDIVIVGGGLVGNSLALALAKYPLNIAIIEAVPTNQQVRYDYDARSIALSYGSKQLFEQLSLWQDLSSYATPIRQVHVSDKGHFGFSRIDADKMRVPALGYVIEMQYLLHSLISALGSFSHITRICPATVSGVNKEGDKWQLDVLKDSQKQSFSCSLLIAADGGNSSLRKHLNLQTQQWDYEQNAIIANIGLAEDHGNIAFERFTNSGPLALLPMTHQRSALVWTEKRDTVEAVLSLSDADFLSQLQKRFGYRLGKFIKVGKRFTFPLKCTYANEQIKPGFVLLGNSAHTLHPIAGQGFNLCLRDVMALAKALSNAIENQQPLGDQSVLDDYYQSRKRDQLRTLRYSDNLVRVFSNDFLPITWMRNLGMVAMDLIPFCKRRLAKLSMGLES